MNIKTFKPEKYEYTKILSNISDCPSELFYKGTLPNKRIKTVAIVGSRKPTAYGRNIANKIANRLAEVGIVVISGLALGIDSVAHRGALERDGLTIAVLANGLDMVYPAMHRSLAERIISSGGAIISEYPINTKPLPWQFLARNRIISGLADVIVVVEASKRSGTLSTASHGINQGKEVFAVPGNITSPYSEGCNHLIKMGATPLIDIDEFIKYLVPEVDVKSKQAYLPIGSNDTENFIINKLRDGEIDGDEIFSGLNISISEFNQALTMLEIKGIIKSQGGNRWNLG